VFQKHKKNFFSQNGEDGVILEILIRLGLKSKKNGVVNLVLGMEFMEVTLLI